MKCLELGTRISGGGASFFKPIFGLYPGVFGHADSESEYKAYEELLLRWFQPLPRLKIYQKLDINEKRVKHLRQQTV